MPPIPETSEQIPHGCLIKIKGIYNSLKNAERKAVDYLLSSPGRIATVNIVDFANEAGCSEATLVRLSRKLGYQGFPDLKADFANLESEDHPPYRTIEKGDSAMEVARKVFQSSQEALKDTLMMLQEESYEQALDAMLAARKLAFIGIGNASVSVEDAYQKFLKLGVTCYCSADPDLMLIFASTQLTRGDVLLAVSYSGQSKPILNAVKRARETGITVIAVTNFPHSPLTKLADIVLLTAVFQEHLNGEIVSKRIAQLCILESLYVNYLVRRGPAYQKLLNRSNEAMSANKTS